MPATEDVWRNLKTMHVVSAVSALALLAATLWMMQADYADEWRPIQRMRDRLEARQIDADLAALDDDEFKERGRELREKEKTARDDVRQHETEVDKTGAEVKHLDGQLQTLTRTVKFQRAERDAARADLELKVRDGYSDRLLKRWQERFDAAQAKVDQLELELQELQGRFDEAKAAEAQVTKPLDDARTALNKHRTDLERLEKAKEKIQPEDWGPKFKRWLMEQWIVEGFNGPLKINQIWLPNLTINFGGMRDVARYDRCTTCHVNIDKVATGNVPNYPFDEHGISMDNAEDYLAGRLKRTHPDGSPLGYYHPFATHPNPELYLTSASPHPMQKFGCTSCHDGQGSGTSFHNASHSPDSPDIAQKWHDKYGYSYNHFWEFPMFPKRLAEASCVKCHHNVVELGINPEFGTTAPRLFKGFELVRQYGCFGCHEINGFSGGKPIGPDMRLEPQTPEEAERIAADPTAVAGTMRKVGPGLRHISSKTTKEWAEYWVQEPKRFHPETRMPQFFGLTNQDDAQARLWQPVEIAGIVAYLFDRSEKLKTERWAEDYKPDAERGKKLFSQRGCLACHAHDDFEGIKADFGPNLTHAHQKITSAEWLYTWLREPTRHSARTRMPNLFLEPEKVGDELIDPAADIAAFLLAKGPGQFKKIDLPGTYFGATFEPKFSQAAARRLEMDKPRGALVSSVMPGSAATRAFDVPKPDGKDKEKKTEPKLDGLRLGDVILKYNDIQVKDAAHLEEMVAGTTPGRQVRISIWRDGKERQATLDPDTPLHDMSRWYLRKGLGELGSTKVIRSRKLPEKEAERIRKAGTQPDEFELVEGLSEESMLLYVGRRSVSRYGCYGCHDIAGFEKARPIGTALQDWGRKDPTKLALEHIEEYLHHHGEPDGSSTEKRAEEARTHGLNDNFKYDSEEKHERETCAAYFYGQLVNHGRAGFLWQKLRDPRSYDYKKIETKGYDERLRMPKFPFSEADIEAIANFILGLVAEPPAEQYVFRPSGAAKSRIEGEKLLAKYNCVGCHSVELPKITGVPEDLTPFELPASDYDEIFELLLKLKPKRDARTKLKLKVKVGDDEKEEQAISFHGMLFQPVDPEDDPADQREYYDLWETISLGDDKLLIPGRRMEIAPSKIIEKTPGRGGAFAEWLVNAEMAADREVNRDSARHMAPPTLYREGIKVQTPWLYSFLKDPGKLRFTTVLRMPQFNMSNEEAENLANYFAAVDGVPYPYQEVPQREPEYLSEKEQEHANYLHDAWRVITMAPPTGLCAGCHSVGGREFVAGDPTKVTRGPNLDAAQVRLRPDWVKLWVGNPKWITPYTKMPQNFPRDKEVFPELFGGDGLKNVTAARDALMNYLRILEREGKATASAPATAASGGEGGNQ
jgi:cytochrome c551/c552